MKCLIEALKKFEAAFGKFRINETDETCSEAKNAATELTQEMFNEGITFESKEFRGVGSMYERAIQALVDFEYMFCVYEDDKPCITSGINGRNQYKFSTLKEATAYLYRLVGSSFQDTLPGIIIEPDVVYTIYGMNFTIKREKK